MNSMLWWHVKHWSTSSAKCWLLKADFTPHKMRTVRGKRGNSLWTKAEVDALLGEASRLFCRYYDITGTGNWEHGNNILHLTVSLDQTAKMFSKPLEEVAASIESSKAI